jgi:3-oxoadipate enol-lactonase / 4-carboxymuconolactone decarboxylase
MTTIPLHYRVDGPAGAPYLVLLNSVGSATPMWEPCVAPLAEHFQLVRVDARGHGESPPAPAPGRTTIADLGADVLGVLDALGADRVHLAGLSLGGMTGMWLAVHHPARIARLGLLCTSAYLPPASNWTDRASAVRAAGSLEPIADAVLGRWTTPGLAARDPELVAGLRAMLTGVHAESYAQCCEAIAAMDQRADLPRIASPTLVIGAHQDPATPPDHQREIAAGIPGARLELLDDCAHIATVEQPGRVAALLLDHFGGRPAAARTNGMATRRAVLGDAHVDRALANTSELTAAFQDFLTRYAWGEVWSRPGLARRDRSIATLAAVVTLGAEEEIAMHVRGALRNGLTPAELAEVLLHTALYAGLPRANRAHAIAQRVLSEEFPGQAGS